MDDLKQTCPRCSGNFFFPKDGLDQLGPCPHCNSEIRLNGRSENAPSDATRSAKPIGRSLISPWSLEGRLYLMGCIFILIGFLGVVYMVSLAVHDISELDSPWPHVLQCGAAAAAFVIGSVLQGIAEIMRLLKK